MEISKQFTQLWVRRWTSKWKVFTVFTRLLMKLKTHQMSSVNVAYCYSLTRFMLTQPSWWSLAGSALFLLCKIVIGDVWSSFCRRLCCCCHFSWRMCELWFIIIKGSEIKKHLWLVRADAGYRCVWLNSLSPPSVSDVRNGSAVFWEEGVSGGYQALLLDEDKGWLLVGGKDHIYLLKSDSLDQPSQKVKTQRFIVAVS